MRTALTAIVPTLIYSLATASQTLVQIRNSGTTTVYVRVNPKGLSESAFVSDGIAISAGTETKIVLTSATKVYAYAPSGGTLDTLDLFVANPLDTGFRPVSPAARIATAWTATSSQKSISSGMATAANFATSGRYRFTVPCWDTSDATGALIEKSLTGVGGTSAEWINVRFIVKDQDTGAIYPAYGADGSRTLRCQVGMPVSAEFIGPEGLAGKNLRVFCDEYIDSPGTTAGTGTTPGSDRLIVNFNPQKGDGFEGIESSTTLITERTTRATCASWAPAASGQGFMPILEAIPANPSAVLSTAVMGDSRAQIFAYGETEAAGATTDTTGFIAAAAAYYQGSVSCLNMGTSGARLNLWVANNCEQIRQRVLEMQKRGVTRCLVIIGRNDIADGRTSAQVIADTATLDDFLAAHGIQMWIATETPTGITSTTDNYRTAALQVVSGADATRNTTRIAINTSRRSVYATRYVELADALESARDSGKWADAPVAFVVTANGAGTNSTTSVYTTSISPQIIYGQYRNAWLVWRSDTTTAALRSDQYKVTNSIASGGDSRLITTTTMDAAAAATDVADLYDHITTDGIHYQTNAGQARAKTAVISSGFFVAPVAA